MALYDINVIPYVGLSLDEGSTMSRKLLDFNIENPDYPIYPYPAVVVRMTASDTESYVTAISDGLNQLSKYKINIAGITVDGQKAQWNALNSMHPQSLMQRTKHKWIKKLLLIPCGCHRVNNSY